MLSVVSGFVPNRGQPVKPIVVIDTPVDGHAEISIKSGVNFWF